MSVITILSEDEDECISIYSDEEEIIEQAHTIFLIDDSSNEIDGDLSIQNEETRSSQLPIRLTEDEPDEDPFAMCSEVDVMGSGVKENTFENAQLNTNITPVNLEAIIGDNAKNTLATSETNHKDKSLVVDIDGYSITTGANSLGTETFGDSINCTAINDRLNSSIGSDDNIKDLTNFSQRLAKCLTGLIKRTEIGITCDDSSKQENSMCPDGESSNAISVINEVSQSTFFIDTYAKLKQSSENLKHGEINLNKRRRGRPKRTMKSPQVCKAVTEISTDSNSPLNNEISQNNNHSPKMLTVNTSISSFVGLSSETEECTQIKTAKKRGRKKGWRKKVETKTKYPAQMHNMVNRSETTLAEQSNIVSSYERLGLLAKYSKILKHALLEEDVQKLGSVEGMKYLEDLTQLMETGSPKTKKDVGNSEINCCFPPKSSNLKKAVRKPRKTKQNRKVTCKKKLLNISTSQELNQQAENPEKNCNAVSEKAETRCPPIPHLPAPDPSNSLTHLSPPCLENNSSLVYKEGKAVMENKQNTTKNKSNDCTISCKTGVVPNSQLTMLQMILQGGVKNPNETHRDMLAEDASVSEPATTSKSKNNSLQPITEKGGTPSVLPNAGILTASMAGEYREKPAEERVDGTSLSLSDACHSHNYNAASLNTNSSSQSSTDSQLKTYVHYYNLVFDDEGEYLCMKMGDIVLLTGKEARGTKSRILTTQNFTCHQLRANEILLAKKSFYGDLMAFRTSFGTLFSKLLSKLISSRALQAGRHAKLLMLTWFLKIFLRVASLAPEFGESLSEVKAFVKSLLQKKYCNTALIYSIFGCGDAEFDSDCCVVVQYMKSIFDSADHPKAGENNDAEKSVKALEPSMETGDVQAEETGLVNRLNDKNLNNVQNQTLINRPSVTEVNNSLSLATELAESPQLARIDEGMRPDSTTIHPQVLRDVSHAPSTSSQSHSNQLQALLNASQSHNSSRDIATSNSLTSTNNDGGIFSQNVAAYQSPVTPGRMTDAFTRPNFTQSGTSQYHTSAQPNYTHMGTPVPYQTPHRATERSAASVYNQFGWHRGPSATVPRTSDASRQPAISTEQQATGMNHEVNKEYIDINAYVNKRKSVDIDEFIRKRIATHSRRNYSPADVNRHSVNTQSNSKNTRLPYRCEAVCRVQHSSAIPTSRYRPPPPYQCPNYSRLYNPPYNYRQLNSTTPRYQGASASSSHPSLNSQLYRKTSSASHQSNEIHSLQYPSETYVPPNQLDLRFQRNNHYSSTVNPSYNHSSFPGNVAGPPSQAVQAGTYGRGANVGVTVNNFNITNVSTPVANLVGNVDTRWNNSPHTDVSQSYSLASAEPVAKETIHYLGSEVRNNP